MKKYGAEFCVDMIGHHHKITLPHEIENQELLQSEDENPSHIYMITSRPKILLFPDDNIIKNNTIEFTFGVNIMGEIKKYKLDLPIDDESTPKISIKSSYPYNNFEYLINDKYEFSGSAGLFLSHLLDNSFIKYHIDSELVSHLNLEILYIGQSYGTEGSRRTIDRLKSHSTLQEIISKMHYSHPDKEIMLVLWSFEPGFTSYFDGRKESLKVSDEETTEHMERFFKNFISEEQRINFTEAALIKYFQPQFNKVYKNNFPNGSHKSYSECYSLDVNNVSVYLNSELLNLKLYSEIVPATYYHDIRFFLHSIQDRADMFNYTR